MAADKDKAKTSTFSIQMGGDRDLGHRPTRPSSGRPASTRFSDRPPQPTSNAFNRAKSGMVSYEDLLVAQYLDDLRRQKTEVRSEKEVPPSPYLQRLPHANLMHGKAARRAKSFGRRHRPFSASMAMQGRGDNKPKIDAKFIADDRLWDPATPRDQGYAPKHRPASAPIKRSRPMSGISTGSYRRRSRPGSAYKSVYKRQPRTISVVAFKNGTRDVFVHAAAPTLKILLEFVTEKLGLGFAARRIFLEDGVEVCDGADIPPHADVYISCGEPYKDPFGATKKNMIVRQGAKWNLQGIILPEESKKRSKHRMSKRLRSLAHMNKMRIIIYRNGRSSEPCEVVVEPDKFDEFLQACTGRLELRRYAKKAYDWEGNEITDLEDTPILDDCMKERGQGGQVRGPLWISTGEQFSPLGTQEFLMGIKHLIKQKLKNAQFYKQENPKASTSKPKAMTTRQSREIEEAIKKVKAYKLEQAKESGKRMAEAAQTGYTPPKVKDSGRKLSATKSITPTAWIVQNRQEDPWSKTAPSSLIGQNLIGQILINQIPTEAKESQKRVDSIGQNLAKSQTEAKEPQKRFDSIGKKVAESSEKSATIDQNEDDFGPTENVLLDHEIFHDEDEVSGDQENAEVNENAGVDSAPYDHDAVDGNMSSEKNLTERQDNGTDEYNADDFENEYNPNEFEDDYSGKPEEQNAPETTGRKDADDEYNVNDFEDDYTGPIEKVMIDQDTPFSPKSEG